MKLPPFGKQLLDIRNDGKRPKGFVVVTDSWDWAALNRERYGHFALVVQPPSEVFDFSPVFDLDVKLMLVIAGEETDQISQRIKRAQPRSLQVCDTDRIVEGMLAWWDRRKAA